MSFEAEQSDALREGGVWFFKLFFLFVLSWVLVNEIVKATGRGHSSKGDLCCCTLWSCLPG